MASASASTRPRRSPIRMYLGEGRWRWIVWPLLLGVIALLAARLYLPTYLKDYVNTALNSQEGYRGSVKDIDVALLRGAYVIKGLELFKIDKGIPVPFVAIAATDISVEWKALLQRTIVAELVLNRPVINFATSANGTTSQTGTEHNWNPLIDSLVPIEINRVLIRDGRIAYRDFSAKPPTHIYISGIEGEVTNLRNVNDEQVALPSQIRFTGTSIGGGALTVKGKLNTLTTYLDMDIDTTLENAKLEGFNSFTNACCSLEFRKGTMDLYSELAVKDNQVTGYLKPLIKDLSVDRVTEENNPLEILWATAASVLFEVFENQPRDQFATKVPLRGDLNEVDTSLWPALGAIVRNAFIEAFRKGTDNEISFEKPKPSGE